jgi:hypothetical protein
MLNFFERGPGMETKTRDADLTDFCLVLTPTVSAPGRAAGAIRNTRIARASGTNVLMVRQVREHLGAYPTRPV